MFSYPPSTGSPVQMDNALAELVYARRWATDAFGKPWRSH